ncbi:exonuclease domain-containing protein [Corynebacterium sp.]|uniref:exonuclease domain-containing protein n=1 Tax=Corynebacterium sp. TaxID=1720 RepID=UPI0026DB8D77|nr:exonuclease domain-containing protein [Corynebacterium sp.]MDO5077724.1 exonuclease domain-containing protein [Corynebacterium sp.]
MSTSEHTSPQASKPQLSPEEREARRAAREAARARAIARAPYVAVTVQTSGIHPSTSRIVAIDAVTFSEDGTTVDEFHAVVNTDSDPGPKHLHGLTPEDVAEGKRMEQLIRALDRLLDGRTLVVHHGPRTWGFLVSETRRALKQQRSRGRSRNRNRRGRRPRRNTGHIPKPASIVDTLASVRRRDIALPDTRLRAVAHRMGCGPDDAAASISRAQQDPASVAREETLLLVRLFLLLREGELTERDPAEMRADRFGLQRSNVRTDAPDIARRFTNPGVYIPGNQLIEGMEVVVTPEIRMDPNTVISAAVDANLAYSEKLTRTTSVVVCNHSENLRGKAMHAQRKGIPLVSDAEFLQLARDVAKGTPAT